MGFLWKSALLNAVARRKSLLNFDSWGFTKCHLVVPNFLWEVKK